MISVTVTWEENTSTERIFDMLGEDEQLAIAYLVSLYPDLTPKQRKSIRVVQNGMKCTNATMLKVERAMRDMGYVVIFPVAVERPGPCCPHCKSPDVIKVGRYPDGKCKVLCLDCRAETAMTNGEYYTSIVDADQP